MHTCQYCHKSYEPRPQVKNPKACGQRDCQRRRQKDNQAVWRAANRGYYDSEYHAIQKEQRTQRLQSYCEDLLAALKVGGEFLQQYLNVSFCRAHLFQFLQRIGLRRTKKLWLEKCLIFPVS